MRVIHADNRTPTGYAYTKTHWFWWNSYHINMCDVFYTMDNIATKKAFLKKSWNGPGGSWKQYLEYAGDLNWLQVSGKAMLHEMMHTDLIGYPGPHIDDLFVNPKNVGIRAYGPRAVWQLANRSIEKGGGANRSSINADSYAQMMTAMYWWKTNGHTFPGVPGQPLLDTVASANSPTAGDDPVVNDPATDDDAPVTASNWDTIPIFLHLGNVTDPKTDWDDLYNKAANPSFFPSPTAAVPTNVPSDVGDHSVCGGCEGNGD